MPEPHPLLVPGAAPSAVTTEVRSPYDGALIATVATAGEAAVEQALVTAYALFRNRDAWLPPAKRIEILHRTAALMQEEAESIGTGLS